MTGTGASRSPFGARPDDGRGALTELVSSDRVQVVAADLVDD